MTYEAVVLADSPVFLWMLQDTSGTTAADATGNGDTGTYGEIGGSDITLAQSGPADVGNATAAAFGGGSLSYVNSASAFTGTAPCSAELWFSTVNAASQCMAILVGGGGGDHELYIDSAGHVGWYINTAGNVIRTLVSTLTYTSGAWHHAVGTYDGSTEMVLYVDGAQVNAMSLSSAVQGQAGAYWLAGFGSYGEGAGNFDGSLAALATYTKALTSAQVSNHYDAATAGTNASAGNAAATAVPAAATPRIVVSAVR